MVARQRTCLSNTVGLWINSWKTKHQRLNGRPSISSSLVELFSLQVDVTDSFNTPSYGASVTGRFCFKVSMRDKTPRFTLVVTLLVTESGGGGGRTFCEGGLATKHFWYRNWNKTKSVYWSLIRHHLFLFNLSLIQHHYIFSQKLTTQLLNINPRVCFFLNVGVLILLKDD